ncbi:Tc toxin subunit A-related protein [Pseudomonas helleri]|uniref:Tc toxin subunit A-related protein n=1 Tax=Pseudomonas helleri TaxID=1608996 RepID=UPI003FD10B92
MNETLLAGLNESRRDALVAYYIQRVIPDRGLGELAEKIVSADDLYEYLLLDTQVSGLIKTSRIAEAVASVQLYLHRCQEQLEPDTDAQAMQEASRHNGYFSRWNAYSKRYANWAGLQRLLHYPASYIDPELRYNKTQLFVELESAINQGRVTEERVEQAFTQYVSGLRNVLDIRYDSGYQVEPAGKQGVAYFCGSIPGTTGEYYWRRVDATDYGEDSRVRNAGAWTEWLKIDAPLQPLPDTVPSIVYFDSRLHVLCVHEYANRSELTDTGDVLETQLINIRELQVATLLPSGQWKLRNYPLANNALGVFAVELRDVRPDVAPSLGVFFEVPKGLDVARYNKTLQPVESLGVMDSLGFIHELIQEPYSHIFPVRQPISYTAATEAAEYIVKSDFYRDYFNSNSGVGFKVSDLLFSKSSDGKLSIDMNLVVNYPYSVKFAVEIFYSSSGVFDSVFFDGNSHNATVTVLTNVVFDDFAIDRLFRVKLILNTNAFDVELSRVNDSAPATFKNIVPNENLWISTSRLNTGRTQMLYTMPGQHKEFTLTTLAGPLMEQKMLDGVDALLSWDLQQLLIDPEDYAGNTITRPLTFIGGVGLYTWEVFFHAPLLIANRLLSEQRFDEAERWFKRIFDPAGYRDADGNLQMNGTQPRYWNVRPLQEDTAWNPSSPADTDDPDVIAAADPMHYKLAVYLRTLELLSARGDHLYRQQTRDSLSEARMWYVQALQMLGPRPTLPLALAWDAPTLNEASSADNLRLLQLEQMVEQQLPHLAPASVPQITVVNGPFRAPVDAAVLAYWDRFEGRLYNLRYNLSIDGQPLSLRLFELPTDPRALQMARLAGDGAGGQEAQVSTPLWPQRFPVIVERARAGVQQVIQFGANLQSVLERRDADALSVMQQTQQGGLLAILREVHRANLASLDQTLEGMKKSQASHLARQQHYEALYQENISSREQQSMDLRSDAGYIDSAAGVLRLVGGGLNTLPTMAMAGGGIGFAMGGAGWGKLGSVVDASSDVLRIAANVMEGIAGKIDISEHYRRRRQDWDLQRDQARREAEQLTDQIAALNQQKSMTLKQQQQTELEQAYSAAVLEVMTTRFTGQALFNWQAARLATLYYQLYDSVSALCTQAQASLRWETSDLRNYLRPGNWNDLYQGLLAGESLLLSLQQMENAYLQWDRRALEVRKTVSLLSLSPSLITDIQTALTQKASTLARRHEEPSKVTVTLKDEGLILTFDLKDMNIANDYPDRLGARRLLKALSVSLPALLGPYQDVQALLSYSGNEPIADGCTAVAISHGLNDNGLFQLDFNDGKYLPFEGIPVKDAAFSLMFPNAAEQANTPNQQAMLMSLNDIILHINYTIR